MNPNIGWCYTELPICRALVGSVSIGKSKIWLCLEEWLLKGFNSDFCCSTGNEVNPHN